MIQSFNNTEEICLFEVTLSSLKNFLTCLGCASGEGEWMWIYRDSFREGVLHHNFWLRTEVTSLIRKLSFIIIIIIISSSSSYHHHHHIIIIIISSSSQRLFTTINLHLQHLSRFSTFLQIVFCLWKYWSNVPSGGETFFASMPLLTILPYGTIFLPVSYLKLVPLLVRETWSSRLNVYLGMQ